MKNLELNQMESLFGSGECYDEGNGLMVGATVAGAVTGGPIGLMVGGLFGLIVGTALNIINC